MNRPNKKRVAKLLRDAAELCAEMGEQGVYDGACVCISDAYWETVRSSRSGVYKYADFMNARSTFNNYMRAIKLRSVFWFGSPRKENVGVRVLALCFAAEIVETEGV